MKPSLQEIKNLKGYTVIPISTEIMADVKNPIQVLKNLKFLSKKHFLLESVEQGNWSRYSFLGFNPKLEIFAKDYFVTVHGEIEKEFTSVDPMNEIREIMKNYQAPSFVYLPPFAGGLVGYVGYDTYKYNEKKLKLTNKDVNEFNDYHLMLFDQVIAFDHYRQKIILIENIKTDDLENNYSKAIEKLNELEKIVLANIEFTLPLNRIIEPIKSHDTFEEYKESINKAKNYIKKGDIFQVVLARTFRGKMEGDLFNTYRILRTVNPSPYMVYMDFDSLQITGASPETLVKKRGSRLETFPIAGTRPRGRTPKEDLLLEEELLRDDKELSEHNMLVDLGRNDLGRVSRFNSVEVLKYLYVQRFSHVMHITSTVSSIIKDDLDAIDALKSILPAGTLSGAPKLRACEIINELEPTRRGIYGGAMGYIDFCGNMDMCIVIRTAVKKSDDVIVMAGGGIVLDSVPENEYQETENKARSILLSIEKSEEVKI